MKHESLFGVLRAEDTEELSLSFLLNVIAD